MNASYSFTEQGWVPAWAWQSKAEVRAEVLLGDLLAYGCAYFPEKIAVADRRDSYSFQALEDSARRMAAALRRDYGVGPGERVMVIARKSCHVPALAIALWKIGAVYMPVDAEAPHERLAAIVQKARPSIIVSSGPAPNLDAKVIDLSVLLAANAAPDDLKCYRHAADDIAYVIHTSGSTGVPKGVEISVSALMHYFSAHNKVLRYHPQARVFSLTSFHFDVSIEDTILPLSLGAYVHQYDRLMAGDIMRKTLISENITHLIAVSTLLTMISEKNELINRETFPNMEMVMTGAELCAPEVINLWKQRLPQARVINAYGPTEVTIVCTCYEIEHAEPDRTEPYPIGRPLDDTVAILLDEEGNAVTDVYARGELCLGGPQVMAGYLGLPEETSKRIFVRDGVRFYRSGDLCFRDEAGDIHFVGRNDNEVKIAGRRIHLGEIQSQCQAVPGVERAVVGLIERAGTRRIAAVIVAPGHDVLELVRARIDQALPVYMRPTVWGITSESVISGSGKTDDRTLLRRLDERFEPGHSAIITI